MLIKVIFFIFLEIKDNKTDTNEKKLKDKLRLNLEISYENKIIYKTEFFENVIIPNIIFEGINTQLVLDLPKKKNEQKSQNLDFGNDNIPYSISCTIDLLESTTKIKNETIEWTMRFFSSDTLAICKNMSKESNENKIREKRGEDPGRYIKAKNSRIDYLIEKKITKEGKLNLNTLNNDEVKYLDYFKHAEGSKEIIAITQQEELGIVVPKKEKENEELFSKDEQIKNKKNKKAYSDMSAIKIEQPEKTENIIKDPVGDYDENLNFFKSEKYKQYFPETTTNFFNSRKNQSKLVSNFMNYVEEDRTKYKKNNLLQSEHLSPKFGNFFSEKKPRNMEKNIFKTANYENFEKNRLLFSVEKPELDHKKKEKINLHIKTFYDKSNKTVKNFHCDKNQLMKIREDFRTTFNNNKDTEAKIFNLLEEDKDGNNLDQVVYMYKQILLTEKKSTCINKIHGLISKKKDEIIGKKILLGQINKANATKILNDVEINKWNVNPVSLRRLEEIEYN